jgi:hypothetical protein
MPNDAEMRTYATSLPPVYRDIMTAFPEIEPGRKAGYGLAFQTLAAHFTNTGRPYGLGDVREACMKLAENGFFEIRHGIFAHPTELGEQLIAAVTGRPAAIESRLPPLPAHNW